MDNDLGRWLDCASDPAWAVQACEDLTETLRDHAHCEKKAAQAALSLINTYPSDGQLVAMLGGLAADELSHFREIHDLLMARGAELTRDGGDPYAQQLMELVRQPAEQRKLDRLLISALIEARSCERFRLLAEEMQQRGDSEMAELFERLAVSELGHAAVFHGLARRDDGDVAEARLAELRQEEARIVRGLPLVPRIH